MEITGKGVVVTGAGSGIGRGIALALAQAGAEGVIVADVQQEKAEGVAAEILALGGQGCRLPLRRESRGIGGSLGRFAWQTLGHVEILCNNAGVVTTGPGFDTTEQDLRWQFEVNVFGVFFGCKSFGQRF